MDLPQPPQDTELRNIIDKLAQFVARNGPEFEQMTKNKQKGNPKFQFLYGGEHFNYYQYKVTTEQAIFKQQQQQQGILLNEQENNWNTPPPNQMQHSVEIEQINKQQDVLREQIKQSEQNLTAQHTVLLQQQQTQVEQAVAKCEAADLQKEADRCEISLTDIHSILQPIIDSCTKDSISNGKSWFLQHATDKEKAHCIVDSLLYKVLQSAVFSQKLHIIYLVNDLLHHSARKNAIDLKDALERVVVPMFCNASIAATADQKLKLDKLLKLWESKTNYLKPDTLDKMRNPLQSYQQYQAEQIAKYNSEVSSLAQQTKVTFDGYQAQHQAFVCHAMQQIMDLQQQKQNLEQIASQPPPQPTSTSGTSNIIPLETIQASLQQTIQNLTQGATTNTLPNSQSFIGNINSSNSNDTFVEMNTSIPPPNLNSGNVAQPSLGINNFNQSNSTVSVFPVTPDLSQQPPPLAPTPNGLENLAFTQPPPGYFPPPGMFPDFSKPPPGFPAKPEPYLEELMPSAPYYDLPAGLMVPLVKLEETSYKPLDPKDIRLPPPAPPSDRLLAAVEAFYSLPSHERPRDSEGWEKLGLYEYYKAKNIAKKEKEELIEAGLRQKSRSPSPVEYHIEKEPSPPKRRYRSKSPSPPTQLPPPRIRKPSKSKSRSRSRSRSRSPRRRHRDSRSERDARSDRDSRSDRDRSDRDSRRERRRRSRTKSRSRSRSPLHRSISPPPTSFSHLTLMQNAVQELDPSNKGHQMLKKMGWGGSGLGANEQGIDTPISGGDVRDRQDQFKGVGCNLNDPYENFRKNKGAAFITRMKARAEERAAERRDID